MRSITRFVFPLIAILAIGVMSVSAQSKIREIERRMDTHNRALSTLRAKVTMVKTDSQLGESDTSVGTAIYAKKGTKDALVRIDWQKPEETLSVVDGKYFIYKPRLNLVYTGSVKGATKNGSSSKASSAFAFMSMSRAELNANYDIALLSDRATLSNGTQTFHLRLTPKSKTSYQAAELWVDVDGMPVQSKIVEANNDTTTVLLSDLQKNVSLKTSNFKIDWPKNTKIQQS